jgi:iron complex outermembrane receptor protein
MAGVITLLGAPAHAAAEAAPANASGDATNVEEIIVTGSSIKRVNVETASPVEVIGAAQLHQSGFDTVTAVLSNLTANGAGTLSSNNSNAFAGGASGVALRGLSVGATLVLVDGHRLAPYPLSDDGERQFTDVNSIPFNAVERVEVLKDGASAVYGSDAIAGVVNVILKKQIIGVEAMAEGGTSQHGGGTTQHYGFSAGKGDLSSDGYNAFFTVEYRDQDPIYLSQRSYQSWGANNNYTSIGGLNFAPGAPNFINAGFPATLTPYLVNPANNAIQFLGSGCNPTALAASQCTYPSPQKLESPTRNINVLVGLTKDFGDGWEAKLRVSFFDSKGQQSNQSYPNYPGSSFGGNDSNPVGGNAVPAIGAIANYLVPANFPGNTLGAPAYLEGVIPQLGPTEIDLDTQTYRIALDVTGKIAGWDVTGAFGYSLVNTHESFSNYVNYASLYTLLTNASSVGLTPFNPLGGNSAADLAYIAPNFRVTATDSLAYAEVGASRKLLDLPGGDLSMAAGVDFYDKELNNPGPLPAEEGLVGGIFNTYAIGNQIDAAEYVELDANLFHQLELNVAVRDDYYDTYGNSFTPKFGVKWRPSSLFAVRGTFSEGFRAPSPAEVGQSATVFGLGGIQDPVLCPNGSSGPFPAGTVPAACSSNPGFVQKTNPLQPETSTSYTAGFVVEPIRGFSATMDYYHITIDHQIVSASELPSYNLTANCVRGPALAIPGVSDGNGNLITGVPVAGPLDACFAGYVNAQSTTTSGLDLETSFRFTVAGVKVTTGTTWTHMLNYDLTGPNGVTYQLAGTHGPSGVSGDTGNPTDRINAHVEFERGPFALGVSDYWINSYSILDPSASGGAQATCAGAFNAEYTFAGPFSTTAPAKYCRVGSFNSVNMTTSYKVNRLVTVTFSVDNLFDANAPLDAETYGANNTPVNPALHEDGVIGRFFRLGVNVKY